MSHEDDLAKVKQNGYSLREIKNQTPEICLSAVQQYGMALEYISKQTPDTVDPSNPAHKPFYDLGWRDGDLNKTFLEAVKQNGHALKFIDIKHQSTEICMEAIKQIAFALDYVKSQTVDLCLTAVAKDFRVITSVKDVASIADLLHPDLIKKGLSTLDPDVKEIYESVVKIRKANEIAEMVNSAVSPSVNPVNKKARL